VASNRADWAVRRPVLGLLGSRRGRWRRRLRDRRGAAAIDADQILGRDRTAWTELHGFVTADRPCPIGFGEHVHRFGKETALVLVGKHSRRVLACRHGQGGGANKHESANGATAQSDSSRKVYPLVS